MKMNGNKLLIQILALVLLLTTVVTLFPAESYAETSSQLKKRLKDIEEQQVEVETKISALKNKKNRALDEKKYMDEQVSLLNDEIMVYQEIIDEYDDDIAQLDGEIEGLNNHINALETQIVMGEEKHDRIYKGFKTRIRVMYEEKLTSFAGILLLADSITDFFARLEAVGKVLASDIGIMKKLEDLNQDIEKDKDELAESRRQVQVSKTAIEVKRKEQEDNKSVLDEKMVKLEAKQSEADRKLQDIIISLSGNQDLLKELESKERKIENEIREASSKENSKPSGGSTGGSSSSASFAWPLPGWKKITSYFGNRTHPVTGKKQSFHTGIDIGASGGTPIKCSKAGTVIKVSEDHAYGNMIVVDHGNGMSTMYAHMRYRAKYSVGAKVSQGTVLGYVGTTGLSTGNHLHFSVLKNGNYVNPLNYVKPS